MGSPGTDRELMSAADVGRTVSRIAHQIIEKTALDGPDAPHVILLGIPTRGVTLANRLAAKINEFSGVTVARGGLDITLYRDDLDFKAAPCAGGDLHPGKWVSTARWSSRRRRALHRALGAFGAGRPA